MMTAGPIDVASPSPRSAGGLMQARAAEESSFMPAALPCAYVSNMFLRFSAKPLAIGASLLSSKPPMIILSGPLP